MSKINDFFSPRNTVNKLSNKDIHQTSDYLMAIEAFSRLNNLSLYVIDYQKKGFEYVSDNPLFLCGYSNKEVKQMGYEFYFKCVAKDDLQLLLKINQIGFDFYETIPLEDRINYSISYDFHLQNQEGNEILVNQKLTPLFLTEDGKIWKALCLISLSNANQSGHIRIYNKKSEKIFEYDETLKYWRKCTQVKLSNREKEILQLSIRGFKIGDIAERLFISSNTVKFHRKQMFEKMQVTTITEAIFFASKNNLL